MQIKSVRDADVSGKRVIVRLDFDVPLENGAVVDDTRLRDAVPTLALLREHGATIIGMGHVGRPKGVDESLRVAPVAAKIKELAGFEFEILENLRFDPREEANDESFAKELASKADIFVNESFAAAHRAHSSVVGIAKLLPSYAGLQFEKEVMHLSEALTPPTGSVALVALTKADKLPFLNKLATLYSKVCVGGPVPEDYVPSVPNIMVPTDGVPERSGMLDIGQSTRAAYVALVESAPFVLWNGPLGWYEKGFVESTDAIANTIISKNIKAIIGGGDTVNALKNFHFGENVFISTAGGAMLEFLVDGTLPAIDVLRK